MHFGSESYSPPYNVDFFHVADMGMGQPRIIWVVSHQIPWFPSVITKLDGRGNVLAEFWHSGHINTLSETIVEGRRVVLFGGTHNAVSRGTLAILDFDNAAGSSPSPREAYLCRDCPSGTPLAYLLFPRSEISSVLDSREATVHIFIRETGQIEVGVNTGGPEGSGEAYIFDASLQLRDADMTEGYRAAHAELRKRGLLKIPLNRHAAAQNLISGVEYWDGSAFAPLRLKQSPLLRTARTAIEMDSSEIAHSRNERPH